MQHVDVSRVIHAPAAKVFERYSDFPSWTRWARLGEVSLQRPGDGCGVGAVRVIRNGPSRVVEEVTASEPPSSLTYRLISGFPLRNHVGRVAFTPQESTTTVRWQCEFDPPLPGLGPLLKVLVRTIFSRALKGLDAEMRRTGDPAAS